MRPSLAVSLLFLSLLVSQAQGIRLDKGSFMSAGHKIKLEENGDLMKTVDKVNIIVCKDGDEDDQCNSGKTRKLTAINTSTSTTKTIPKNNSDPPASSNTARGFGREEETMPVNFPASGHREQYPDIVDIAEMDYSPARRKPPIHN